MSLCLGSEQTWLPAQLLPMTGKCQSCCYVQGGQQKHRELSCTQVLAGTAQDPNPATSSVSHHLLWKTGVAGNKAAFRSVAPVGATATLTLWGLPSGPRRAMQAPRGSRSSRGGSCACTSSSPHTALPNLLGRPRRGQSLFVLGKKKPP